MAKKRVSIPKKVSEAVLKEFRHSCSVCTRAEPQLHHIDGNPSNNTSENLLPLCPNCHLQDAHDPTRSLDSRKVQLFRRTRDPAVLDPRFDPLWKRLVFLHQTDEERVISWDFLVGDFLDFVASLQMGEYYSKRIKEALKNPISHFLLIKHEGKLNITKEELRSDPELLKELLEYRATFIEELCVEMLRFQSWDFSEIGRGIKQIRA